MISVEPAWSKLTIFAVIVAIVGFSMFMGKRSPERGTRGGWWAGLIVLLIILSGFFGLSSLSRRGGQEVRHAGRVTWVDAIRGEAQESAQAAKNQIEQAVEEAKKAMGSAMKRDDKRKPPRAPRAEVPPAPAQPTWTTAVRETVVFDVTLDSGERPQNEKQLEVKLKRRAADRVVEWVRQNLSHHVWGLSDQITPEFLEKKGAFPEGVQAFEPEMIPRSGSESDLKDPLYNGRLQVVLHPDLQHQLMTLGVNKLDEQLKDEKLNQQGVIFAILMVLTAAAGGIGSLCYVHRWWKTKNVSELVHSAA